MPFLEIIHMTGDVDRRELSKRQPVTIGSHHSNDVIIDEDGVEIMHCRISWGKQGFEAVAAGVEGLDVNGTPVHQATLKPGDTLRFGTVDVRFREAEGDGADVASQGNGSGDLDLKPITEEVPARKQAAEEKATPKGSGSAASSRTSPEKPRPKTKPKPAPDDGDEDDPLAGLDALAEESQSGIPATGRRPEKGRSGSAKSKPKPARKPEPDDGDADDLFAGLDALAEESQSGIPTTGRRSEKKRSGSTKAKPEPAAESDDDDREDESPSSKRDSRPAKPETASAPEADEDQEDQEPGDGLSSRLRDAMRSQQHRPGEEDPLRSPLVLGLAGGAVALVLTGAIFFFIAGRQTTQQRFDAAKAAYDEGNFIGSIAAFQDFIIIHPRDPLAEEAEQLLGLARVRQHIEGATPNFSEGLEQLRNFINEFRDQDDFESLHPEVMKHARTISLGAATAAGRQFNPALLDVSKEARTLLRTYAPKDAPPTETLQQIEQTLRASEAAILKNDVFKEHVAGIENALKEDDPLGALKLRRDLLVRYADFERHRDIVALMEKTLEAERERISASQPGREALTEDRPVPARRLTLAMQGRTRTDEVAVGQATIVLAKDCCYGIEFVTGEPLWRRVIGLDSPFFPLTESNHPSAILFDTNHLELVRIHQVTGELIWRQPVGEAVSGQPLLTDDTVYVPTESGKLLAIDVDSGQLVAELSFSQKITGPVELKDRERLVVAGNEEVLYTLTKRPFACTGVSYFGHQADSIDAPLVGMGSYILMVENRSNSGTLRLIETETGNSPLSQVATANVTGRVVDPPVIRGRDLFVPSTGQRVSAFSVSDDPGQPPLTAGPAYQGEGEYRGPVYLLTGPDRQVWMATGALSRLRLTTDALQPDGSSVAPGLAAQPLGYVSGYLMNARRRPYTSAVTFTRTSREEQMASDWQVVVGGEILAWSLRTGETFNLAVLNEAGHAFRIGPRQLEEGPFLTSETTRLPLNRDLVDPLLAGAVSNDRIAVACGDPEPRLWIINAAGQIEGSPNLPAPPQAAPASIGDRVVVPLPGRIHVARLSGQPAMQDFALPIGGESGSGSPAPGEAPAWVGIEPAGEDRAVAVTAEGQLLLLKLESSPRPHLGDAARVNLNETVIHPGAAGDGLFAIADASKKVSLFETERLDPRGSREFEQPVTNRTWIVAGRLFVEEGMSRLHCIEPESALPSLWMQDLEGASVAGIAVQGETFVIARQDGIVTFVDRESGEVQRSVNTHSPLSKGPLVAGEEIFVATLDGTLIRIQPGEAAQVTTRGDTP
jgi:TolA-binding protein